MNAHRNLSLWTALCLGLLLLACRNAFALVGDIAIYSKMIGGDTVTTADFFQDWDTIEREDPGGTYSLSGSDIQIGSGHFAVLYNSRFDSTGGSNRSEIQSGLHLDGADLPIGWSQGYMRRSNGDNKAFTAGGGIIEVGGGGGTLSLKSFRTDDNTGAEVERLAGASGIQLLQLDDTWDYARLSLGANQAGPVNTRTWVPVGYDTQDELDLGSFGHDTTVDPQNVTLKTPGHYLVFANTYGEQSVDRSALIQRLTLDGTEIAGSRTNVYIRGNQNGCAEGAASLGMIIETTGPDQVLNVEGVLDVNRIPFNYIGGRTGLTIAKLPDDADYIRLDDSGTDNFNPPAMTALGWDTEDERDFGFTHADSQVGAAVDDDYLFLSALYDNNDAGERVKYGQQWQVNGTDLFAYGQTGRYARDNSGADTSGNWSGIILDMAAGDYVESVAQQLGNTGTLSANRKGLQGVRLSSLFTPPVTLTWNGGAPAAWTSENWHDGDGAASPDGGEKHVVNSGKVLVTSDPPLARDLTIDMGEVEIRTGSTLNVAGPVNVPDGTLDVDGTLLAGSVTLGSTADFELAGTLNTPSLLISSTNTISPGATLIVADELTLLSDLDLSGATLTTTNAAVTVSDGWTLTHDEALAVGGMDLRGTLNLTAAGNRVVTVNGGAMSIGSSATLTNALEEIVLNAASLEVDQAADMSGTAVSASGVSAIAVPGGDTDFAALSLADGSVLTTSDNAISFSGTSVPAGAAVTLDALATTLPGPIAADGATITKTGEADLVLDPNGSGMTGATTLDAQAGRLVAVQGATNPLGTATVTIGNGGLLLAAADGTPSVTYDNAITVTGAGTLTAGGVAGAATAATVTAGGTNGITLDPGSALTIRTADDYTVNLGGSIGGAGELIVPEGTTVNVIGAATTVAMGGLDLSGGLAMDAGVADKTVAIDGGTMTLRDSATLSNVETIALNAGMLDLQPTVIMGSVPADPVAYWKFNEGADATAGDSSVHGHAGTLTNFDTDDSQWVAGVEGTALAFDDVNDFVVATGYQGVTGTAPRSMSAWIKVPESAGDESIISWGDDDTGVKWHFRIQTGNGQPGAIRVEVSGGYIVGSTDVRDGQWHHVAAVFGEDASPNVNDVLLYVDGQPDGQSAAQGQAVDTAAGANVRIGQDHANRYFNGTMDEVMIYDRALSPGDVAGMFGGATVTDVSGVTLSVNGNSTVKSGATGNTAFAGLNVADGVLTAEGKGTFSFGGMTIAAGATATGVSSVTDVDLGSVDGGGAAMTFDKTGAGNLAFSGTITALEAATVDVQEGGLSMASDAAVTNLRVATGTTVDTGGNAVTISDTLTLGDVKLGISGATMTASGSNLAAGTDLTVGGGTMTIALPSITKVLVVSDANDPDVGGGDHNDDALVPLLKEMGYQVDTSGMGQAFREGNSPFSDQDKLDAIDAADVILFSRRTSSGSYDNDRQSWNAIAKPLLSMSAYITRGTDKWGWTTAGSNNVGDRTLTDMTVVEAGHEFLNGLSEPMSMFDWSTAPGTQAPKQVYLPDSTTARTGTTLIGTYADTGRPFLIDIPAGFDLDEGGAADFGTTGGRRVLMGHWGYDIDDPNGDPYQFDDFITDKFRTMFGNVLGALAPLEFPPEADLAAVNVTVTANATITAPVDEVALGDLAAATGVTSLTLDGAFYAVNNAAIAGGVTVDGKWELAGTLDVGDGVGVGTLTVGSGELVLASSATYNAEVSLAAKVAGADVIAVSDAGTLHLGGKLAVAGVDRDDADLWGNVTRRVVDNPKGTIGDVGSGTGMEFRGFIPLPGTNVASHVGQGAFLRSVNYVESFDIATGVDLDLFIARGGDADGDGKVFLSDWGLLRSNYGVNRSGMTWTDANFDPWVDDVVFLSDWGLLRARYSSADYTLAEAADLRGPHRDGIALAAEVAGPDDMMTLVVRLDLGIRVDPSADDINGIWMDPAGNMIPYAVEYVPEPGTIVMLLGGLSGLVLIVRRRRVA